MAYKVQWSFSAERNRDHCAEYLLNELHNPQTATRFLDELDHIIDMLEDNPLLFPMSTEPRLKRLGYRKALFMNYMALYVVEGDLVLIARLFHQSQDYAQLV